MAYQQIIDHCLRERGDGHGVTRERVERALASLAPALDALKKRKNAEAAPLMQLPFATDTLPPIEKLAAELRQRFDTGVVAGLGGSGLSGRALAGLVPFPAMKLHFLENIDPETIDPLLERLDTGKTCFIVISKSGSTVETLAQFYVIYEHVYGKIGKKAAEHFIVITMPGENPLRQSAESHGIRILDHERDIGGRYSALTNVGLLPAALAGVDIKALMAGGREVIEQLDGARDPAECPPAVGAALQYAFIEAGYPITAIFPYGERLAGFAALVRQVWAESLGKHGKGSMPITAMGATDQHSQLQLYLEGPKNTLFTMVTINRAGTGRRIPVPDRSDLNYLKGKTMGDVLAAEQKATFETMIRHHCPVRLFALDMLTEKHMGELVMHFMLEVILAAGLLGVDPFNQPAVEDGKRLAREYLLKGDL